MPEDTQKSTDMPEEPVKSTPWGPDQTAASEPDDSEPDETNEPAADATPEDPTPEATPEPATATPETTSEPVTTEPATSVTPESANEATTTPAAPATPTLEQPGFAPMQPSTSAFAATAAASAAPAEAQPVRNNPGTLILQWLTYAFWGWFILALGWLTSMSVAYFIDNRSTSSGDGSAVAYSLAAVLVLFVIAFLCDRLYSRAEPPRKEGAATVIMIIHAVIFALFGIGAVIAAVFAVVHMIVDAGDENPVARTILITGSVIAVVYGLTLARTLRPFAIARGSLLFGLAMGIVTLVVAVLGIVGPTQQAHQTRQDRQIEENLSGVSAAINSYADKNDKLPESLATIQGSLSGGAKNLVERNLVEYKPGSQLLSPTRSQSSSSLRSSSANDDAVFSYQLCVSYTAEKGNPSAYGPEYSKEYDTTPSTYQHDAGRVCYDLATSYYYGGSSYDY